MCMYMGVGLANRFSCSGCTTEGDGNQKLFLRLAYFEAHKIVNVDGVKNNIAWEDIAANDFFGPSRTI